MESESLNIHGGDPRNTRKTRIKRREISTPMQGRRCGSDAVAQKRVNAALAFVEAGPPAGAFVFAVASGSGAGPAADAAIAAIVQRIVGDAALVDVGPDVLPLP